MKSFHLSDYDTPAEAAEAFERYSDFCDQRAEERRDMILEREADRKGLPNPMRRVLTVSGEDVLAMIEWDISTGGTVYIEAVTDSVGTDLLEHVGDGELGRIVTEIEHLLKP